MVLIRKENETDLTFEFLLTEEVPLMSHIKAILCTSISMVMMVIGFFIQIRIFVMLNRQKTSGTVIVIDRLFKVHNVINLVCQPLILIYNMASYNIFPMVDYVGIYGCIFLSHFLHRFLTIFCLCFPLVIATIRYLFVVQSWWTKSFGIKKLANIMMAVSIIIPFTMTVALQYPISDYIHGSFNFCKGRFEVFFIPNHPDPWTPGRRDGERHCVETQRWAFDNILDSGKIEHIFKVFVFISCKISRNLFYLLTLSLPEMVLYAITFHHITTHTNQIASIGILRPEMIKKRKKQNILNIYMTFWSLLVQFASNMILVVLVKFIFGTDQFLYTIISFIIVFVNFNALPFAYIIMGNDSFRRAITGKRYTQLLKLLCDFRNN